MEVFFSSLDADTEGMEGLFYTWNFNEIESIIQVESGSIYNPSGIDLVNFCTAAFGITAQGNFEGRNVLHREMSTQELAEMFFIEPSEVEFSVFSNQYITILLPSYACESCD